MPRPANTTATSICMMNNTPPDSTYITEGMKCHGNNQNIAAKEKISMEFIVVSYLFVNLWLVALGTLRCQAQ